MCEGGLDWVAGLSGSVTGCALATRRGNGYIMLSEAQTSWCPGITDGSVVPAGAGDRM